MAPGGGANKGKAPSPASSEPSSAPADAALGPFAADCANAALREEVRKIYTAIFKKVAAKEGAYMGPCCPTDPRGKVDWKPPFPGLDVFYSNPPSNFFSP